MSIGQEARWSIVVTLVAGGIEAFVLTALLEEPAQIGNIFSITLASFLFTVGADNARRYRRAPQETFDWALTSTLLMTLLFGAIVWVSGKRAESLHVVWPSLQYGLVLVALIPSWFARLWLERTR